MAHKNLTAEQRQQLADLVDIVGTGNVLRAVAGLIRNAVPKISGKEHVDAATWADDASKTLCVMAQKAYQRIDCQSDYLIAVKSDQGWDGWVMDTAFGLAFTHEKAKARRFSTKLDAECALVCVPDWNQPRLVTGVSMA